MSIKLLILTGISLIAISCAKQTSYSLYQTGRTLGVEKNNARKIVAQEWGVDLNYIGNGKLSTDEKIRFNDSVNKLITEQFGENWLATFTKESNDELIIDNEIRITVKSTSIFAKAQEELFQPIVLLKKKSESYIAHIVGQQRNDDTRQFVTFSKLKVNLDGTTKVISDKISKLSITFPVNGIE